MFLDFEPGDFVINPNNKGWGLGQIQSIINNKITVNFENSGKKVINASEIILEKVIHPARRVRFPVVDHFSNAECTSLS